MMRERDILAIHYMGPSINISITWSINHVCEMQKGILLILPLHTYFSKVKSIWARSLDWSLSKPAPIIY